MIKLVIIFLIVIFFVKIPSYVEIVLFHYKAKTNIFALFVIILFLYIIKTFIQKIIHLFRSKFWKTSYTKNLLFIVDFEDKFFNKNMMIVKYIINKNLKNKDLEKIKYLIELLMKDYFDKARIFIKKYEKNNNVKYLFHKIEAMILIKQEKITDAVILIKKLLIINPNDDMLLEKLLEIINNNTIENLNEYYISAIENIKSKSKKYKLIEVSLKILNVKKLISNQKYKEAMDILIEINKNNDKNVEIYKYILTVLTYQNYKKKINLFLNKMISSVINIEAIDIYIQFNPKADYDDLVSKINKYFKINNDEKYINLAVVANRFNKFVESNNFIENVKNKNVEFYKIKAKLLANQGDFKSAYKNVEEYLSTVD